MRLPRFLRRCKVREKYKAESFQEEDQSYQVRAKCAKCKSKKKFVNTYKFRVNANGNRLDVWLIYQCEKCKHTLNLTIYERKKPTQIPKELFIKFQENDYDLALQYGRDVVLFQRNKAEIISTRDT